MEVCDAGVDAAGQGMGSCSPFRPPVQLTLFHSSALTSLNLWNLPWRFFSSYRNFSFPDLVSCRAQAMVALGLCDQRLISTNTKTSRGMVSRGTPIAWWEKGAPWSGCCQGCHRRTISLIVWGWNQSRGVIMKMVICWLGRTDNKFIWQILLRRILTQHWILL